MKHLSSKYQVWRDQQLDARQAKMAHKMKLPSYGERPAAMSQTQRQALVDQVVPILGNWQASRFEHEGACRQGVRSALCLDGVSWPRADLEAELIVKAGLSRIGATVRPTWEQGQPESTGSHDNCIHCGHDLDENQIAHHDKFCSVECVRAHRQTSAVKDGARYRDVARAAQRVVALSKRKAQSCEHCGKTFKKRGHQKDGRFCSANCGKQAIRTIPDLVCENPGCGKTYKTHSAFKESKHHYCCSACAHADRERWAPVYKGECQLCGKPFEKKAKAKFCSSNCSVRDFQYRSGRVVPTRVTPTVFDFFITMPANLAQPKWLSPERFDEMVAA